MTRVPSRLLLVFIFGFGLAACETLPTTDSGIAQQQAESIDDSRSRFFTATERSIEAVDRISGTMTVLRGQNARGAISDAEFAAHRESASEMLNQETTHFQRLETLLEEGVISQSEHDEWAERVASSYQALRAALE